MNLEQVENKRKRLIFRSWHRGTREMDLIMGSFADSYVKDFSEEELTLYDEILTYNDPDLYNWISGQEQAPANFLNPVLEKLIKHTVKG
jgi:antitoxin CptB